MIILTGTAAVIVLGAILAAVVVDLGAKLRGLRTEQTERRSGAD